MGILLILITIGLVISILCYSQEYEIVHFLISAAVSTLIIGALLAIAISDSYQSYVDMKKDYATIQNYATTIELYAKKGIQEFNGVRTSPREVTDLKYNQYQDQIGQMIASLRNTVVSYNRVLAGKKEFKKNFWFNIFIYLPEGNEFVKMEDYVKLN